MCPFLTAIVVVFCLSSERALAQAVCTSATSDPSHCICASPDGVIDVTSIGNPSKTPKFSKIPGENNGDYKYDVNPCYGFSVGDSCSNAVACQDTGTDEYNCGTVTTGQFMYDGSAAYLLYSSGVGDRETQINLICDPNQEEPKLRAYGDSYERLLYYVFDITHKCACPGACGEGTAIGDVGIAFIFLTIAGFMAYFIVGALIMHFHFHKTGSDIIPQKEFWKGFPLLLKDGAIFAVQPIINLIKHKSLSGPNNTYDNL